MAITVKTAAFFKRLIEKNVIQPGKEILEFGESQVLGSPEQVLAVLKPALPASRHEEAAAAITLAQNARSRYQQAYGPARALYRAIFAPRSYLSVDGASRPRGFRKDMNYYFEIGQLFDYVVNNGTSEHVFNQANVYRLLHDHTAVGGVMIHLTPGLGWLDHGLFHAQPGFFFDLARANDYLIAHVELLASQSKGAFAEFKSNAEVRPAVLANKLLQYSMVCAALVRTSSQPFKIPFQGRYDHSLQGMRKLAGTTSKRCSADGRPNLALGKPALQSSTSEWSWSDDPALDAAGGNNGLVTGFYGFCTAQEEDPWWRVDLCQSEQVRDVMIFNRIDSPAVAARAARLTISTSVTGETWREIFRRLDGSPFGGADGNPLHIQLPQPVLARFVKIQSMVKNYLHLDEVEIY
jgi:hypothetical protein